MTKNATWKLGGAFALAFALGVGGAAAQNWPTRFVTLTVPFGAGSGTDVVARIIASHASEALGQQIVIENVAGAGGMTGVARVAKSAPDGYQFVIGAVDTFAQSQYLFKKPLYDSMTEFEPIALAAEQPLVLIVRKELPVNNLKEFADYLKANESKMRYGSAGIGTAPYLACAMLNSEIGVTTTNVPYRSAPPALQDMMSGDIDYYCPLGISAAGLIENKSVKALAVLTSERSPLFPDLPTAKEQGFNVTDGYYWNGFFVPKGTPQPVIETLNKAFKTALDSPALQAQLKRAGATAVAPERRTPEYMKQFLGNEIPKWSAIMKKNGVAQQ